MLFDLEPGVIGAVHAPPLGELFRPGNFVNQIQTRTTTGLRPTTKRLGTNFAEPP
jgi:hypothetical protein